MRYAPGELRSGVGVWPSRGRIPTRDAIRDLDRRARYPRGGYGRFGAGRAGAAAGARYSAQSLPYFGLQAAVDRPTRRRRRGDKRRARVFWTWRGTRRARNAFEQPRSAVVMPLGVVFILAIDVGPPESYSRFAGLFEFEFCSEYSECKRRRPYRRILLRQCEY